MVKEVSLAPIFPVLEGKTALVTGGVQGMGKATCEVFLRAGAQVAMCDVQRAAGEAVAEELSQYGDITFFQTDISKSEEVQRLMAQVVDKYGKLDAAVNNAALGPDGPSLMEFDEEEWNRMLSVNLTGNALLCKYEMQQMKKQGTGGSIINIASINSFRPQNNMPAYTIAKVALIGLTKQAAKEGGPNGIRCNSVAPGAIYSDMLEQSMRVMGTNEAELTPQVSYLHRFAQPHEVAQASLWLASPASSYVTGTCVPVDGGYLAM